MYIEKARASVGTVGIRSGSSVRLSLRSSQGQCEVLPIIDVSVSLHQSNQLSKVSVCGLMHVGWCAALPVQSKRSLGLCRATDIVPFCRVMHLSYMSGFLVFIFECIAAILESYSRHYLLSAFEQRCTRRPALAGSPSGFGTNLHILVFAFSHIPAHHLLSRNLYSRRWTSSLSTFSTRQHNRA